MSYTHLICFTALITGTVSTPALAQDSAEAEQPESTETQAQAPDPGITAVNAATTDSSAGIYTPEYFVRFAPQTALDMVRRVPGFTIEEAEQRRGLGQGGSNVLLNGDRFSSKSTDIRTALGRIGADSVTRIELLDAASLDIPGLSGQVVNLIYTSSGGSGQFRWSPSFRTRKTKPSFLNGEISYSGKLGKTDYTLSLQNNSFRNGNDGIENVFDGAGTLIDVRDEVLLVDGDRPKISATFKREADNGNIANLNLAYERFWFEVREDSNRTDSFRDYFETEKEYNYEIGGDYEFALAGGRLKLIGLHRYEDSPFFFDVLTSFDDGSQSEGLRQNRFVNETETIARGEYRWQGGSNEWQVSLEGALNKLDTGTELSILNSNGDYDPVTLPNGNSEVEEKRAEGNLTWSRPLASNLTLQTSLGAEYSQISQSGPAGLTRSFIRPKGFVSAAWKANETLDVNARIERSVGQLNFFSFVASSDIGSGNQNAGNPELVPQQSWDIELEATKTLGPWGSVTLSGDYRLIEDIIGQIPIGETGEAPGNIDGTRVFGIRANGTVKFDPIGWQGAQIEFDGRYRKARLDDPLTGERIPVSENLKYNFDVDFRHDIMSSDWAYGGGFNMFEQEPGFRLNQVSQFTFDNGGSYVFVEHKDVAGLKVRATMENLTDTGEDFSRTVYKGRRTGEVDFTETRERGFGQIFRVDVSGTF